MIGTEMADMRVRDVYLDGILLWSRVMIDNHPTDHDHRESTIQSAPKVAMTRRPLVRLGGIAAMVALFAGMLFWTKLKLVTDVPRAGYAEPDTPITVAGDADQSDAPAEAERDARDDVAAENR